jgi:hypothetical protein
MSGKMYKTLWSIFVFNYKILNKKIKRDDIIHDLKWLTGVGDIGANEMYAYQVGLTDEDGNKIKQDKDGYIVVNEAAMKRRKKYMREGDLEWYYGEDYKDYVRE